jgi:hypothetical protein
MRISSNALLSALGAAFLLICLAGLGGCDSKPADGTVVQDSGKVSEEQKSKVESYDKDRRKSTNTKGSPRRQ